MAGESSSESDAAEARVHEIQDALEAKLLALNEWLRDQLRPLNSHQCPATVRHAMQQRILGTVLSTLTECDADHTSPASPGESVSRGSATTQHSQALCHTTEIETPLKARRHQTDGGPSNHSTESQLPPGHLVSHMMSSLHPPSIVRRSTSLPLACANENLDKQDGDTNSCTAVPQEGVQQLGQLLCRMMLFPIFRSSNEYLHWKKIFRTIVRIRLPDSCRRKVWIIVARRIGPQVSYRSLLDGVRDSDVKDFHVQIEKDLHRTSQDAFYQTTAGRATLARLLLAYAEYNNEVGYCQSLNFIAANLLLMMHKNEEEAFICLAVLIDQLPSGYFTDLECLAVDVMVFDELVKERLPQLHQHMAALLAQDQTTYGLAVEGPSLTDMSVSHWFPTLFATLLPQDILYRVWDAVLFDGNEMLFRVGLAILAQLEPRLLQTADVLQFYSEMKLCTSDISASVDCEEMLKMAYNLYPFPLPRLAKLRVDMAKKRAEVAGAAGKASTAKLSEQKGEFAIMSMLGLGKKTKTETPRGTKTSTDQKKEKLENRR